MNGETETPEFKQAEEVKVNANVQVVYTLADSGRREVFESGAIRDVRTGKGRFDLMSPFALRRLAAIYEKGAVKYAPRNWEAGIPVSRCLDSALRHLIQYLAGENTEDHLAQAAWNLFAAMHFEEVRPELVDIPTRSKP
jgi:hypothetical protein